jgi:hypothetical protein
MTLGPKRLSWQSFSTFPQTTHGNATITALCSFHVHRMSHSTLSKAKSIHFILLTSCVFKKGFSIIFTSNTVIPSGLFPAYVQSKIQYAFSFLLRMLLVRPISFPPKYWVEYKLWGTPMCNFLQTAVTCTWAQLISPIPCSQTSSNIF